MNRYLSSLAVLAVLISTLFLNAPKACAQDTSSTAPAAQASIDPQKLLPDPTATEEEEQQATRNELEAAIKAAQDPVDQATAHAALANWLLAVPTARPATRWILGMETPKDRAAIAKMAGLAQEHLDAAGPLLKKEDSGGEGSSDKSRRKKLATNIEHLKGLAGVFAAIEAKGNEKARQAAWSDAAVDLSEARESESLQLASASTLWQAMAWYQAGRRDRALTALPEALVKPEQSYDLMARILRCRILGDGEEYAAALALASQIRLRVNEWYGTENSNRQLARQRLVGLLQLQMGQKLAKKLQTSTQPANAQILDELLADVRKKLFPPGDTSPQVYMLDEAVPILVRPPTVKITSSTPSEEAASHPAP